MKFTTIKEYFYKLQSICYALLLLPLAVFIIIYFTTDDHSSPVMEDEDYVLLLKVAFTLLAAAELTIVHLLSQAKLKEIIKTPTLSDRLDQFVYAFILRSAIATSSSLLMSFGFYLTGSYWFTILLLILLCIAFFQRPTPSHVCHELQLKGSERELVLNGELK